MAINYTTLFARIGKGWYAAGLVFEFCGATGSVIATDLPTEWEDFVEQYDSATATIRAIVADGTQQLAAAQDGMASLPNWVSEAIAATILEMADADNPLTDRTTYTATAELIRQMIVDAKTVNANATSATVTYGSGNVGTGNVVVSMLDLDGYLLQCCYDEDLSGVFIETGTAGSERASISGEVAASGLLSYRWPLGSGASGVSLTSLDAALSTNLITNGDFEDFAVTNTPDSWTLTDATVGVDLFESSSDEYAGAKCLKITGDGGTVQLDQVLTTLESRTMYALNVWLKLDDAGATGSVIFKLIDGSGTTLTSEAAVEAKLNQDIAPLTTGWLPYSVSFTLAEPLPATVKLRIEAAVSSGESLFIDNLALVEMEQIYAGGPRVAIFSGAVAWSLDDTFNIAVANDYGGKLMLALWRSLDLPQLGLRIPFNTGGTENILDSVIA